MAKPKKPEFDAIWEDRDIRFDVHTNLLRLRPGEYQIERIDNVEDTKGNNGDKGVLKVTNIRLIWHAQNMTRVNLTIGYYAINGVTTRVATSRLRGQTEALYLMAKSHTTRFEFIFTCLNSASSKLFTTVIATHRAYETSKLYRELKMRGALIDDDRLRLLPLEEQLNKVEGVWNLSSDQGNLGFFIVSNIRVVWYATANANYNVSIPYLQMKACKIRDSKFGLALVIETSIQSGEYVLGFRVDPIEKLETVTKEIQSIRQSYSVKPEFGIEYVKDRTSYGNAVLSGGYAQVQPPEDDIEIDNRVARPDAFAAYFAEGEGETTQKAMSRGVVYSEELGLAIERLKEGFTLRDLWEINVD